MTIHRNPDRGRTAYVPLADLLELFERPLARSRYNESVTQLEHALQCAHLARLDGAADALIAAALLHDIGHLLTVEDEEGGHRPAEDRRHETAGALYLGRWFGPEVTRPVALHVAAKRYLCAVEAQYFAALSPGSVHSLALQGGPMSDAQCDAFRSANGWDGALALRRWDDRAKRPGATVPSLSSYHGLLAGLVVV